MNAHAYREGTSPGLCYPEWTADDLLRSADFICRTLGVGRADVTYELDGTSVLTLKFSREEYDYLLKGIDVLCRIFMVDRYRSRQRND